MQTIASSPPGICTTQPNATAITTTTASADAATAAAAMPTASSKRTRKVVTSYGMICHRLRIDFDAREVYPEYLVIQRKDTIPFVEFVRGKYKPDNIPYVRGLISNMTHEERSRLSTQSFSSLWADFWGPWRRDPHCNCENMYQIAHNTFNRLSAACGQEGIAGLVASVDKAADEQEWSFPKGRKMQSESDQACALREFEEETGYVPSHVHVYDVPPYEEIFEGGNGVLYRHVYYLGRLVDMRESPGLLPPQGSMRARETRQMRWMRFGEVCEKFKDAPTRVAVMARSNAEVVSMLSPGINDVGAS